MDGTHDLGGQAHLGKHHRVAPQEACRPVTAGPGRGKPIQRRHQPSVTPFRIHTRL